VLPVVVIVVVVVVVVVVVISGAVVCHGFRLTKQDNYI
jgi:hypothetical protein